MTATQEIHRAGGAVAASDWLHWAPHPRPRARAVPPGCRHVHAKDASAIAALPEHARRAVAAVKATRPRVRWIIVSLSPPIP